MQHNGQEVTGYLYTRINGVETVTYVLASGEIVKKVESILSYKK